MMVPTLHLNGTSKNELMRQILDARTALWRAIEALGHCAPNGRDYYPQGANAAYQARQEHNARLQALQQVHDELGDLGQAIFAQRK